MNSVQIVLWTLYIVFLVAHCVLYHIGATNSLCSTLSLVFKCFLMPIIIVQFFTLFKSKPTFSQWFYPLAAFGFGLLGDLFLGLRQSICYSMGIVFFAIGHVFFVVCFLQRKVTIPKSWISRLLPIFPIIWLIIVIGMVFPVAGKLIEPLWLSMILILAYATLIGTMVTTAIYLGASVFENQNLNSDIRKFTILLPIGAISFLISDSIIVFTKFFALGRSAQYFIMVLYCLAQALMALGLARGTQPREAMPQLEENLLTEE